MAKKSLRKPVSVEARMDAYKKMYAGTLLVLFAAVWTYFDLQRSENSLQLAILVVGLLLFLTGLYMRILQK